MSEPQFDITRLYPTLDALGFAQGKKMMQFWADHPGLVAKAALGSKSTIGLNTHLPIYTIPWPWLRRYSAVNQAYQQLVHQKLANMSAVKVLRRKYAGFSESDSFKPINAWLTHGLIPQRYIQHHQAHQAQYLKVSAYPPEGLKPNDLFAALGKFSLYAMYKGYTINLTLLRVQPNPRASLQMLDLPQNMLRDISILLKKQIISTLIVITHVGIYTGDLYEFNGEQYLGTWNTISPNAQFNPLDYWLTSSDTKDASDITLTNATFRAYRDHTGLGRDFLALSPIDLIQHPMLIKLNQRGDYVP